MESEIYTTSVPALLQEIPDAPYQLYIRGTLPDEAHSFLTVVGSRKYTPYGKQMCESLIRGLRGYPIVIVSGLALGIDGIAHEAALAAGITTVAVPGSGLDDRVLYPATHRGLALRILKSDGALVSEFEPLWKPRPESFPQRNRIMAGMSRAVLVIEATERSGTLITSRLATEYNRDVFAVPGPAHAHTSRGPHMLIKRGAALIERSEDILEQLNITTKPVHTSVHENNLSGVEARVYALLEEPMPRDALVRALDLSTAEVSSVLASLELKHYIVERLGLVVRA